MEARYCTNCGRALTDTEAASGVTTCASCAASAGGSSYTPTEDISLHGQPPGGETTVNLRVDYPERLSRWLLFLKWLFVIPAYIVVGLYGIAVFVTTFISFWAILFTGRYPSGLFDFARGYMWLYARTAAYFPLLLTDQYPLASRLETDQEVRYEVEEPEDLSRGLLLLKLGSFLLSVVGTLTSIAGLVLFLAAIPAWFAILFTGRYPRGMFDFMVAVMQWIVRVTAWQYLMRDGWSLFATTRPVAYLVGVGAVVAAVLTIGNYAVGPATGGFDFDTGDDQNEMQFIQDLLETPTATTEEEATADAVTPTAATATPATATDVIDTPAAATEATSGTKTFSKYGFSFEYPKEFLVTEVGLFENEASDASGVVQVGVENEEARFFTVSWFETVALFGNYLEDTLDGGFEGLEESVGLVSVDRGELVETDFEEQRMLYQFFSVTDIVGDQGHGIIAAFYCDESQTLFSFNTVNTAISTPEDVLQEFETYLNSFVC